MRGWDGRGALNEGIARVDREGGFRIWICGDGAADAGTDRGLAGRPGPRGLLLKPLTSSVDAA